MNKKAVVGDKYKKALLEREKHVDAILSSPARKKVVVGGPGTGKTYLFGKALVGKSECLTLTFVNALVEDLSLELCKLSDVQTLHGYALSVLGSRVRVFAKLSKVIENDAKALLGVDVDYEKVFRERSDDKQRIEFYRNRKDYYGTYYCFTDIVYAAVRYFEMNREKIPAYEQVLVDEFQDFNKLEVSLIDLLAEKSPVILVGDDDQALYGFKGASTNHIRQRHCEDNTDYTSFSLPYCSRSTRVIVGAVNDILAAASHNGYLKNRIVKDFVYFEEKNKDKESKHYPTIGYAQEYARMIPFWIERQMNEIAAQLRAPFSSLIIAPWRVQCHRLIELLTKKGFKNIESVEEKETKKVTLLDGLRLLLADKESNLGWRIAAEHFLEDADFEKLLKETTDSKPGPVAEIIDKEILKKVKAILSVLRAVPNKKRKIEDEVLGEVLKQVDVSMPDVERNILSSKITPGARLLCSAGLRKLPIKVTTIQGSKGLSADYVFITYFDNQYSIKNKDNSTIENQDICNLLVALTRAKKKVFLVSSKMKEPTFLSWIDANRIERLRGSEAR